LTEPDADRAREPLARIARIVASGKVVPVDPGAAKPGPDTHTPLDFAPHPEHPLRRFFDAATIDGFLERLVPEQQADGGWPIDWPAAGETAVLEWRAIRTLEALEVLRAYGRA